MSKCPHCHREDALKKIYRADWLLQAGLEGRPDKVIFNSAAIAYHMLTGHVEASQYKCERCGGYAIKCGIAMNPLSENDGCGTMSPLKRLLDQNDTFTCPKCGKRGRAQLD